MTSLERTGFKMILKLMSRVTELEERLQRLEIFEYEYQSEKYAEEERRMME